MFHQNKYGLKKSRDFTVSKGHGYPLVIHIKEVELDTFENGSNYLTFFLTWQQNTQHLFFQRFCKVMSVGT
jgi:hypothetical protein